MLTLLQPSFVRSRTRRKGQALILAVLVMLFAVLLSTAFLVVIGNNGRQIGRETDKLEASRNADKGVAFAISQLRASSNPDSWDPTNGGANLPTTTSDMDIYYSQLDKAMGWDVQKFVKYPSPLTSRQAPQFLVSSHLLGTSAADDADGGDKRFMLRITVIGLSSKNPEAWSRRVLYKTTNWNGGTFSYSNFVTSFDPDTQKSIVSTLEAPLTVTTANIGNGVDVAIYSSKGQGNERVTYSPRVAAIGSTLMISDGINAPVVGIVAPKDPATPAGSIRLRILRFQPVSPATSVTFAANSKVALVGSLFESATALDEDGNQAAAPAGVTQSLPVVSVNATPNPYPMKTPQPLGNGSQYNNGLNVAERVTFAARPPLAYPQTVLGQNALTSSGPVSISNLLPDQLTIADATGQIASVVAPTPAPSQNQFFRASYQSAALNPPTIDTANSVVSPVIVPRTIKPALIDFAAYRTRAIASGLYISNADDVEKFNGQPLTTSQLQRLWQRKSFTSGDTARPFTTGNVASGQTGLIGPGTDAARLCYGRPGTSGDSYTYPLPTGGLEAQGNRGWISPWEFLPRGVQIIFNPAILSPPTPATITVISDPLSDGSSSAPDLDKALPAGTRQFTQTLPAAFTGIIAAEGNIRIRGSWSGDPITIVSNNNIYIEGDLRTRNTTTGALLPGRIALLAKKNVVLNPTQFVSRPAGTVDTSVGKSALLDGKVGTNLDQISFPIGDAKRLKLGDLMMFFSEGKASNGWHKIVGFDPDTTDPARVIISIQKPDPLNPLDTTVVLPANFANATDVKGKLACDPPIVLIKGNVADSTTDFYEGKAVSGTTDDTRIEELDPTTSAANTGTAYAYKFAVGGDTLARSVPFNAPVGVAMREAVAKKNLIFTVQGGEDPRDPAISTDDINDDGSRNLESRTSATNPFELRLTPKSGQVQDPAPSPNYDVFDLKQLAGSPTQPEDTTSSLASPASSSSLKSQLMALSPSDTDDKTNRWRLILPPAVAPSMTGVEDLLAARRLSQTSVTFDLTPGGALNPPDDETTPSSIRVPLTPSVVLFSGGLTTTAPDLTALSRIGSTFGFQQDPVDPTKETRFIKATDLAKDPVWDQPAASGTANVVKYTQYSPTSDVAWTRDGAGDYEDQLPAYYVSGLRFQKVVADMTTPTAGNSIAPSTTDPVKTNMTTEVDATIYAEGGSWFVIPVPTPNANGAAPADPDQQIEWRRPAYAITVNGNITQMMTPSALMDYDDEPDADGVVAGAMKRWTDSLSYQVLDGTAKWRTINYQAAPLPAFALDAMGNPVINTTTGFPVTAPLPRLPASTDILYTYSN